MRLPQSILRYFSVHTLNFLTIGVAIALVGIAPVRASAMPQLTCSPAILRFAAVVVGQSETLMVTVTNNGQTNVTVSGFAISNSTFTPSTLNLPLVLAAGQSFDLSVSFTPSALGWTGGKINFSSTASDATLVLGVEGTGVGSQSLSASPAIVSFGQVAMGSSSTVPVVLSNARSQTTILAAFQTMGGGFSISGPTLPVILQAGQSVTVNVKFAPPAAATQGGNLFILGPGLVIPLTGTGTTTQPQYSVNLFWNSSSGVEGYNVYRSTTPNGAYSKVNSALDSSTAYTDGTVASGQTYYYAATSVSSSGMESSRSTPPVQVAIP
jgi:Abnormal spindle-like microcephaly-assoc'd, ASPM-SPD-2-Hydin